MVLLSSVVVPEESPCPRGSSRTNLQVLVLVFVLGPQCPKKFQGLLQTVCCVWLRDDHKFCLPLPYMRILWRLSYLLSSDITYWYMPASKSFFTVIQCCCPRGKSLSLDHKSLSLSLKSLSLYASHKSLNTTLLLSSTMKFRNNWDFTRKPPQYIHSIT